MHRSNAIEKHLTVGNFSFKCSHADDKAYGIFWDQRGVRFSIPRPYLVSLSGMADLLHTQLRSDRCALSDREATGGSFFQPHPRESPEIAEPDDRLYQSCDH